VGELKDRRAQKKAQTRESVRSVAQRLFGERGFDAVTIADVAREADVAVQTVFNHFATKEELFFDGRADWVDGAARAVRERAAGVPPLSALREHLTASVTGYLCWLRDPAHRAVIATLEASPALCAYERELHHECVRRLSAALSEALAADAPQAQDTESQLTAPLTAAVWMAAIRALVVEQRSRLTQGVDHAAMTATVAALAEQVLEKFEHMAPVPSSRRVQITGWPHPSVRRAGSAA
jgi:AcrR family transcriptional regulator